MASYLNDNGYTKKLRQNNTIPGFSSGFVKSVLDNPVYMGKIAYGRRRTEKKIGTRNEMHIVEQDEYPIYDGHHEAIISEADWQLAQEKRKANNFKREKVHDIKHAHILSGLLKCPCCGKSLYGNIAKAHSKDKYTRYYYYCKNTLGATGHKCLFRLNIEQTEMNRMVAAIISAMVKDKRFKDAIKAKIGTAVDTSEMEERIEALCTQLKQVQGTKTRLEHQMDNLDVTDAHYNKKISDLQRRYDEQYDKAETIETQMYEWNSRLLSVRQEKISADNVYQLLLAFDKLYNTFTEVEQRDFMRSFIERIDIYPEKPDNGCWIRNIVFNFPMPVQGREIKSLPLESESTVETVALLSKLSEAKHHIEVKVDMDELDLTSAEAKATYKEIQDWVQEMYGFHVTNLNIAQVKQKRGIIERENYNKPKSEDSKQPGCPSESPISEADLNATNDMPPTKGRGRYIDEEKLKAIEDAMRHFQMI